MSSLTASASSSSESSWGKVLNALKRIILELKYYTLKISWNWFIFYNLMSFWPGFFNFFYRKILLCICFKKLKTENQDIKGVYHVHIFRYPLLLESWGIMRARMYFAKDHMVYMLNFHDHTEINFEIIKKTYW